MQNLWISTGAFPVLCVAMAVRGVCHGKIRVRRSLAPASDGGLWAAMGDGDLYHFDATGRITRNIACPSRLHFVYRDRENRYWVGEGCTLYSFDEQSGRLQKKKTYGGDYLFSMADDGRGRYYLSTFSAGMTIVDTRTGAERHYDMYQRDDPRGYLCNNWIFSFLPDPQGLVWVATSSGVSCYDPANDTFNTFGWHNILEGYACLTLAEDGNGQILIGTDRGLFRFNRQENMVRPFPDDENSLTDKTVGAVCVGKNGDLWCATSMGIWHYAAGNGQMTGYQSGNGLREREYTMNVCQQMADGRIVFSTSEGPVVFHPDSVSNANRKPGDITLTSMLVGGQHVCTRSQSDGRQITTEPLDRSSHFSLSYLDNTVALEFSTFDYADMTAWIDPVQLDKVVQNLLSNAFKFTDDGGAITIRLLRLADKVHITVTDTGTGLSDSDMHRLFNRFYQSVNNQAAGREGTGIGLNLCKMIVEMHGGTITAKNRLDGIRGSQFEVAIPIKPLQAEQIQPIPAEREADTSFPENPDNKSACPSPSQGGVGSGAARILLVDDDAEITDYIAQELSAHYRFTVAANGKEALQQLLPGDKKFDLVVSDIMMPEMDGFTLLRSIKSNISIAHLPVVLLTSEAALGNRLEGLERGADAFMAKPFLVEELHVQIDNLLKKAERLKAQYGNRLEEQKEKVEQPDLADNDQRLMDRIIQSVNKNLSDSEFSVETLAQEVGLSRAQLHRRMKQLTGLSASDFVRNIRMEQAARLLRERHVNVSQVAYSVGFSSLGTFSKVFKQHFGQPPSEYASQS